MTVRSFASAVVVFVLGFLRAGAETLSAYAESAFPEQCRAQVTAVLADESARCRARSRFMDDRLAREMDGVAGSELVRTRNSVLIRNCRFASSGTGVGSWIEMFSPDNGIKSDVLADPIRGVSILTNVFEKLDVTPLSLKNATDVRLDGNRNLDVWRMECKGD